MIVVPSQPAEALEWLIENRLLPVVGLLREREVIPGSLFSLATPLAAKRGGLGEDFLAYERQVLDALRDAGVRFLVLKGCLLDYLVYPEPGQRWRTDLDVLVCPAEMGAAREVLAAVGHVPIHGVPGGTPIRQETWRRDESSGRRYIDVHWGIRDHPLLRDLFSFDEQYRESVELSALAPDVRGQGHVHALLNSVMHWYDDLYEHRRPLVWLLDNDLLWRAMSDDQRAQAVELATERGIAGLLADVLGQTREAFQMPVSDSTLATLAEGGRNEPATRLISVSASRYRSFWFALRSEPGWSARFQRLRRSLFPPAAHMRERYPRGSRLGLVGLYVRRIFRRIR